MFAFFLIAVVYFFNNYLRIYWRGERSRVGIMAKSVLFRGISNWLLERALVDADLSETVAGLGRRLVRGGVPVFRINFGSLLLHPVLGALDLTWDALSDTCRSQAVPRAVAKTSEFKKRAVLPHG